MHNSSSIQVRSQPQPSATGTALLCVTLLLAYTLLGDSSATASDTAHQTALLLGIGLLLSLLCDAQQGLRNLVRTDTVCLLSLYGLIMVERLTKDELFNSMNTVQTVNSGLSLVLLAFGGLAIGRHLFHQPSAPRPLDSSADVSIRWLFAVIVIAFAVSVLHILLSTSFSVSQIYEGLIGPRFARPWMRGRLGGWHTLLNELSLLFYLIPPLAAIIASRWRECSLVQIVTVSGICFFTFFEAFAGGTRNVFLTHLISFSAAYILMAPRVSWKRMSIVSIGVISFAGFATHQMLEFRQVGLKRYLTEELYHDENARDTLFIDDNLTAISQLTAVFPEHYPYLGWEVPLWAAIKPIPRALWPGKPEGLSTSIEEALNGDDAFTIATTFIGEAYMAFGTTGVILTSLLFGWLAGQWNRFAGSQGGSMEVVIFASGFFTAAITMRSLIWMTTAMLPTVALLLVWHWYLKPRLLRETFHTNDIASSWASTS